MRKDLSVPLVQELFVCMLAILSPALSFSQKAVAGENWSKDLPLPANHFHMVFMGARCPATSSTADMVFVPFWLSTHAL